MEVVFPSKPVEMGSIPMWRVSLFCLSGAVRITWIPSCACACYVTVFAINTAVKQLTFSLSSSCFGDIRPHVDHMELQVSSAPKLVYFFLYIDIWTLSRESWGPMWHLLALSWFPLIIALWCGSVGALTSFSGEFGVSPLNIHLWALASQTI